MTDSVLAGDSPVIGEHQKNSASRTDLVKRITNRYGFAMHGLALVTLTALEAVGLSMYGVERAARLMPIIVLFVCIVALVLAASAGQFITRALESLDQAIAEHAQARENLRALNEKLEAHVSEISSAAERRGADLAEAQKELRRQAQFVASILGTVSDGVVVCDQKMNLIEFNRGAEKLLGSELRQRPVERWPEIYDLIPAGLAQPLPARDWPLARVARGEQFDMTWRMRHRQTDRILTINGRGVPLRDDNGAIRATLIVFSQTALADELAGQFGTAPGRALRLPTLDFDLLSKVDGEIKVALNKIKDNTEHLLETPVNGEQRSKLLTIGARRDLLMSLTDDILDYSKLAGGKMIFASEYFDLRETVTSAVESLTSYAEHKGSTLRTSIGELPRKLCGDRNRLSQMLTHFIRAAVELLRPGDVVLNVAADSPGDGGKLPVRFEIPLPGADLTAETRESFMMPPMTEELGEADTGTSRLGLALAARIIQAMGGAVSIEDLRETGPVLTACVEFEPASAEKRSTRLDCPSLDPAVLADIRGLPGTANTNEGVFRDLVTVFLRYLPARLENLDNAMSEGNGLSLARQTHALRGACAGMGAARLALLCAEVETLAENNDTEAARPILLEIRKEAECVRGLLQLECERQQASEIAAAHTV